jgi:predicted Zn-dependent protease
VTTMAHELGHVLGLQHNCKDCLMHSRGYVINDSQVNLTRKHAISRIER